MAGKSLYHRVGPWRPDRFLIGVYRIFSEGIPWSEALTYEGLTRNILHHPTYFALMVNLGLAIMLFRESYRQFEKLGIGILFVTLILTAARAQVILGMGILGGMMFLLYSKWRKWLLVAALGLGFLFVLALVLLPEETERFSDLWKFDQVENIRFSGVAVRLHVWEEAILLIKDHPVFGLGSGDVQSALDAQYQEKNLPLKGFDPHNQYLRTALDIGIPGSVFLIGIWLILLRDTFRARNWANLSLILFVGTWLPDRKFTLPPNWNQYSWDLVAYPLAYKCGWTKGIRANMTAG